MNKKNIIAKTLIAGLACVALCGTTLAARPDGCLRSAPAVHGGGKAPQKAPTHQKAPAPKGGNTRAPAPAPRVAAPCGQPPAGGYPARHGAPVAHHAPAPAPAHHHTPPHDPSGRCRGGLRPVDIPAHHHDHHEGAGWVALGATVIGGIVGGIIGACN